MLTTAAGRFRFAVHLFANGVALSTAQGPAPARHHSGAQPGGHPPLHLPLHHVQYLENSASGRGTSHVGLGGPFDRSVF